MTYGLRGKAMVTLVAISICSVCSAASVSARIELCFSSPVVMPSKPAASARCTLLLDVAQPDLAVAGDQLHVRILSLAAPSGR